MSRRDEFACFFCDYWWIFLFLLMLIVAAIFTRPLWGPALSPPTPTPLPTATLSPSFSQPTPGTGDVQVTLSWSGRNDLDLHVMDPMGEEIFFDHKTSASHGVLDIDSNAGCNRNVTEQPIENIYWPFGKAPDGTYKITVVYYENCISDVPTVFLVRALVDGQVQEFSGQVSRQGEGQWVYDIER